MVDIKSLIDAAVKDGYSELNAESKVCQDLVLAMISESKYNRNITVKGGVVMRCLTNNVRRATQDMDLDFIRYSLADESIDRFVSTLNSAGIVSIKRKGTIEELKQQDYHGKRIYVELADENGYVLDSKIDLGVHKHLDILQDEFCFDVGINDGVASLLINSKEQMLTEKLRSILKFGPFSTRYKDVFDIYYLFGVINNARLKECFEKLIYSDTDMRENNLPDIFKRTENTFSNKIYLSRLNSSEKNWLDTDINEVLTGILECLKSLQ